VCGRTNKTSRRIEGAVYNEWYSYQSNSGVH
jgi:hypothetical protein